MLRDGDFFDAFVPVPDYLSDVQPKDLKEGGVPDSITTIALKQVKAHGSVTYSRGINGTVGKLISDKNSFYWCRHTLL